MLQGEGLALTVGLTLLNVLAFAVGITLGWREAGVLWLGSHAVLAGAAVYGWVDFRKAEREGRGPVLMVRPAQTNHDG